MIMYSDNGMQKPILAFLPFCSRSVLASLDAEDGLQARPQAYPSEQKSTRGNEQKGMQKSDKKSALIPYLDNIETTLMKIFLEMPIKSAKSALFLVNRFLSLFGSTLSYDRILRLVKKERWGSLFGVKFKNKE